MENWSYNPLSIKYFFTLQKKPGQGPIGWNVSTSNKVVVEPAQLKHIAQIRAWLSRKR